jgi:hypothetical protein
LFQTEAYARAVLRAILPDLLPEEIERRVQLRMDRQSILHQDDPPRVSVVLDEALLGRPVGSREIMRGQLDRLVAAASSQTVTLQVLQTEVGAHAGLDGPFTIVRYSKAAEADFVVLDSVMPELYLEDPDELDR